MRHCFDSVVDGLMHRSAVRRLGCSAVRLFGGSVVWLFGGSAVRLFGCSAIRRFGCSAVRRFGCSAVRRFGGSAVRRFGGSAVRRFGWSVVRLFGCSFVRRFGCSAVRRLGPEGAKIEENGVWRGRKSRKILVWRGLVGSWGSGGRFGWNFRQSLAAFRQSLAARWSKMDQVGTKLAASCAQESPRCCQDGQLGHFVASFGTISDEFCFFVVSFFAGGWE